MTEKKLTPITPLTILEKEELPSQTVLKAP